MAERCAPDLRSNEESFGPMTDPMELVGRLETYADPHEEIGMTYVRAALTEAAACIREMVEKRVGLEEDLYQAVLVAYRRGAITWAEMNYPQWIGAIKAGREVCPPAPGAEDE